MKDYEQYRMRAQESLSVGDFEMARQIYLKMHATFGDHPDTHYGLATSCFMLSEFPSAIEHFKEVIRLDPLRAGAYVNLGAIYNRCGQYEDAIHVLRKGIQLDSKRAEGFYNLGIVYRHKDQLELAIQAYREAVRINPRMADAHYNLANVYFDRQETNMAIAHYREALKLRPGWEKAQHGLTACQEAIEGSSAQHKAMPVVTNSTADPNRVLDPNVHGELLRDMHHSVIDVSGEAQALYETVHRDVEVALRDLSNCLLFPNNPQHNLAKQTEKFDVVVARIQQLQKEMKKNLDKTHQLEQKILSK